MSFETILLEVDSNDHVATITLNRPEQLSSFNRTMCEEMARAWREVKLDDAKLIEKGAKIRTLFITLYDAASAGPRPYGAMKVQLDQDAKGVVYKGTLDSGNVMVMGGGETPQKLRIKAKLDKDGSAGPDAPGDLIGTADGVAVGGSAAQFKVFCIGRWLR